MRGPGPNLKKIDADEVDMLQPRTAARKTKARRGREDTLNVPLGLDGTFQKSRSISPEFLHGGDQPDEYWGSDSDY